MFKKEKNKDEKEKRVEVDHPASTNILTRGDKSIIGEQISIEGTIKGKGDLVIEGTVKGSIEVVGHHLTVGTKGQVESEILADNVTISGKLKGNVNAKGMVEITRNADFEGEIKASSLSVQDGANLKAGIELRQEPTASISRLADKTASQKEKETAATANETGTGK
jgi:cytoskeletal protein CcmA (bactofilin family)